MQKLKLYLKIKKAIEPYLFFWGEWIENGNCNLYAHEIKLMDGYVKGNLELSPVEDLSHSEIAERVDRVLLKLELGSQVFKDFVIVDFLQTILQMAKTHDDHSFLTAPISDLQIAPELKNCLLKFKCQTLQLIFLIYPVADFNKTTVYAIIVEFQTLKKQQESTPYNILQVLDDIQSTRNILSTHKTITHTNYKP